MYFPFIMCLRAGEMHILFSKREKHITQFHLKNTIELADHFKVLLNRESYFIMFLFHILMIVVFFYLIVGRIYILLSARTTHFLIHRSIFSAWCHFTSFTIILHITQVITFILHQVSQSK